MKKCENSHKITWEIDKKEKFPSNKEQNETITQIYLIISDQDGAHESTSIQINPLMGFWSYAFILAQFQNSEWFQFSREKSARR